MRTDRRAKPQTRARRAPRRGSVERLSRKLQRALAADRPPVVPGPVDPVAAADAADLQYVSDTDPGITRRRQGRGFAYRRPDGRGVSDAPTLARIRKLAIPPAWTDVWICPDPNGHIQATGRDERRRKQYRYHERWREVRDRTKYGRMIAFGHALPGIRRRVRAHLALPGLSRDKVMATVVRLLETTSIRVGSDEYARTNGHYGLTTLRNRHVEVRGPALRFRFLGKSGKTHEVGVQDPRLARIVRECQELPGQRLFQYFDEDGEARQVRADDVNAYLREVSGSDFTAKDFRTWMGTVAVAEALFGCAPPASAKAGKEAVLAAIDGAAARLGNTRAICRKSYVHPAVIDAFMEGEGPGWPPATAPRGRRTPSAGLDRIERATLCLLERAARRRRAPAG